MRRDLERQLRRVEIAGAASDPISFWIDQGDGTVSGPLGARMTREAFDLHRPGRATSGAVLVLRYPEDLLL